MSRTRKAIAAVAVVATLGTGSVTACTGPPPTQTDIDNIGLALTQLFWLAFANAFNLCLAPCDPAPGQG